jgi:excisionase family DNA binding protein
MALRNRKPRQENDDNVIEINAQMQGSLNFKDDVNLKINGNFAGSLETRGTLTIGSSAEVHSDINGDNIIVAGKVTGDIIANTMLVLMPTAVLKGNISTPKLNIVEGAIFQGNCQMLERQTTASAANLLSIKEVSKYLEIGIDEIEQLANSGDIPGTKEGSSWKFERNQIDNWAASAKLK